MARILGSEFKDRGEGQIGACKQPLTDQVYGKTKIYFPVQVITDQQYLLLQHVSLMLKQADFPRKSPEEQQAILEVGCVHQCCSRILADNQE